MKIIDILNKKANGELEDGFKFKYRGHTYIYQRQVDIIDDENNVCLGEKYIIENSLKDEVEVIEENKEIKEIPNDLINEDYILKFYNKINELVRAVNKINKEREEK